jgi:hypothetical protein
MQQSQVYTNRLVGIGELGLLPDLTRKADIPVLAPVAK